LLELLGFDGEDMLDTEIRKLAADIGEEEFGKFTREYIRKQPQAAILEQFLPK
jgi:hypothetical protein